MSVPDAIRTSPSVKSSTNGHAKFAAYAPRLAFRALTALSPDLAARAAKRLFFTPVRAAVRGDERAVLAHADRFSLHLRAHRVEGYAWGRGPAVLLVHGWGGHAGHMTALVRPLTRAGFRCIALDMVGHGASGGRQSSLVHFTAAIMAAGEVFGQFYAVIGHSMGGAAAVNALAQGLAADRAVLIAAPATFDAVWAGLQSRLGLSDAVLRSTLRRAEVWLKTRMEDIATPVRAARSITAPVLVLHAPDDRQVDFEEGASLAAAFPDGAFKSLPGLGHVRILKDWRTAVEVQRFLSLNRRNRI